MHVTSGLLPGFVIAYVENLAMLSSVIIVLKTTGKHRTTVSLTHYSSVVVCKNHFFCMQGYSSVRLEVICDSAVSYSGLMTVLLYALILLTRTAIFFVAHRLPVFFFDQIKYIFRDITLLI
jgi:hypothetical protein